MSALTVQSTSSSSRTHFSASNDKRPACGAQQGITTDKRYAVTCASCRTTVAFKKASK